MEQEKKQQSKWPKFLFTQASSNGSNGIIFLACVFTILAFTATILYFGVQNTKNQLNAKVEIAKTNPQAYATLAGVGTFANVVKMLSK